MATPASSSLFSRLANAWRILSLRSDVDDIILELLGRFSLEKIYSEGDKETYQHLVITLLAQLNTVFYIQRFSLPSENVLQVGWYLGFLASWEVILRSVEFVLQTVVDGREALWEAPSLIDKHLAELLLSALRVLTLHPKAPTNQRAKDRRERFARIHRSLERVYDSYPGRKSFLLLVCKDITDSLRTEPNALALPSRLRYELPNLASELYPLPDCLSPQAVSEIIPQNGFSGDWLSQFLALRDVSQFVVGASVQYTVNQETRDMRLQSSSARVRNAVLHALDNIRLPAHLNKMDLASAFSETFRIVLPDTLTLVRRSSTESHNDESEMDAIDALCMRLNDRQVIHRVSDREMMHNVSEITRNIALIDDPSGQFRAIRPRLYAMNCPRCHLAGDSQLRSFENFKIPLNPIEGTEISLPSNSKCIQCSEPVTMLREVSLARHTWDLLKPLESSADTINVERHLPTQFLLTPPRTDTGLMFHPGYAILSGGAQRSHDPEPPAQPGGTHYPGFSSEEQSRTNSQAFLSPSSPGRNPGLDTPRTEFFPSETSASNEKQISADNQLVAEARRGSKASNTTADPPFSPDSVAARPANLPRAERTTSNVSFEPAPFIRSHTAPVPLSPPPEKGKSKWRSKLSVSRKESVGASMDSSSLSSTTLESQRLDEISLKSLISVPKKAVRGKSAKNINVYLSHNSTYALFWTQLSIQIWDVGATPPSLRREVSTESTCLLAAITKVHLAYIIRTQDQRLTLRIVNLVQPSVSVVEHRMSSSLWCKSITICPKENYVVVGFENSVVRFFRTATSENFREDSLHPHHKSCRDCPPVDTLSFSHDGAVLLASIRNPKNGIIQIYSWPFPFDTFQELTSCRYHVPLHESEDNGVSSAIFRSGPGAEENLICITTWTQSGIPILIQPESGHRSEVRPEMSSRQSRLGSRIQSAAFSPSGRELAMVNDKGHLYKISSLNSNPMEVRKIATSKELMTRSDAFAMAFMTLPDEEAIVLAWADSSKGTGFVKKIPVALTGDVNMPETPGVLWVAPQELPGNDSEYLRPMAELTVQDNKSSSSKGKSKEGF